MRKLKAELIYTLNGPPVKNGIVVLDDSGFVLEVLDDSDPRAGQLDGVEIFNGAIVPGFINAHCHLELSHLKGKIASGNGLVAFIQEIQTMRNMPDEIIHDAMRDAESQMLADGIVAIGDISNSAVSFSQKASSKLDYHTFIESFSFMPERAAGSLESALKLKEKYISAFQGSHKAASVSISPHAPYSVSKELFELLSKNEQGLLSIHNQESEDENEFYKDGTGKFQDLYTSFGIPIAFYKPYGTRSLPTFIGWLDNQKKLLVHNTFSSKEDILSLPNKHQIVLCFCPKANLYIEGQLPEIEMLHETNLAILIGTDSLASNDSLSMIDEMRIIQGKYPQITFETMLEWACFNAARFFNWPDLGSIQKGKKPGIVLIENLGNNQQITLETKSRRIA